MFFSFRKNKEAKCIFQKDLKVSPFKNVWIKNICDVVEITNNPRNAL